MAVDFAKQRFTLRWQLPFGPSWPSSVAFLADGKLAAGNQGKRIIIWDVTAAPPSGETPKNRTAPALLPVRTLAGHTNAVSRLCASADGRQLFSASLDHTVKVWNLDSPATGETEVTVEPQSDENRKGSKPPPTIKLPTQQSSKTLQGHGDWVSALAISTDGKRLVSGDFASRVIVWDTATGAEVTRWSGLPWNWIASLALNSDGSTALVAEYSSKRDDFDIPSPAVRTWDVKSAKESLDILKVQFPKYDRAATSYEASQLWRKFTGDGLIAAAIAPDGKSIALGQGGETDKGTAHLIDAQTGKLIRDLGSHQYGMTDVCFSNDGRHLLSTGRDTCLRVTTVADGKEVTQLGTPRGGQFKDWFSACAKSADEQWLAAADIAGWVHVWTVAS